MLQKVMLTISSVYNFMYIYNFITLIKIYLYSYLHGNFVGVSIWGRVQQEPLFGAGKMAQ